MCSPMKLRPVVSGKYLIVAGKDNIEYYNLESRCREQAPEDQPDERVMNFQLPEKILGLASNDYSVVVMTHNKLHIYRTRPNCTTEAFKSLAMDDP